MFIRIALFFLAITLLTRCTTSKQFVAPNVDFSKYKRISVFPLADFPGFYGSGSQVSDMVSMSLMSKNLNVIDRTQTASILGEQAIGLSDVVDPNTAPNYGKLLGVQAILTSSINEYKSTGTYVQLAQNYVYISSVGINLKLIDAETGQIVWTSSSRNAQYGANLQAIAAQSAVEEAIEKLGEKIDLDQILGPINEISHTELPNIRRAKPNLDKYSDEEILSAYRSKYAEFRNKSDSELIKLIESKYK